MRLLTINAGSSSVRLVLYAHDGVTFQRLDARHEPGDAEPSASLRALRDWDQVDVVAHRVVHGGDTLVAPCALDARVEAEIERLAPLAPLHNPRALAWIRACRALHGAQLPQVAMFDTGFYAHLPEPARRYALPNRLGVRRYGFHGLAHQAMWRSWCARHPQFTAGGRVISLQLGSGSSMTAISAGVPRDTSMGFSPLEGLVMATRGGDLDPGVLLHLLREGMTVDMLDTLLNKESGLYGLAGESDMRKLLASTEPEARQALEFYCYRARKYLGAYLAVLGGADAILFGGGVGEHAAPVRAQILAGLEWAGIHLDTAANANTQAGARCISAAGSRVAVWVIRVDENLILAEEAAALQLPTRKGGRHEQGNERSRA